MPSAVPAHRVLRLLVPALTLLLGVAALTSLSAPAAATDSQEVTDAAARQASYRTFPKVIGRSVQQRPIVAYFRGDRRAEHQVLLLGQMHGDERAGVRTAHYVKNHLRPKPGVGLWIIPTMNPDGNARNTRQNARGVDLNRNWPTDGWTRAGRGGCCWGGTRPASTPEVRAMLRFLEDVRPDYIASIHQPFGVVARNGEDRRYERRLSRHLGLPLEGVPVGGDEGEKIAPTLTSWYNDAHGASGTSVTLEFRRHVSWHYKTVRAGTGVLKAMQVWRTAP